MIRDTIRKLSNIFKPQFFVLHIKKYDRNGKRKYSIRVRFATEKRTFVSKACAWDLRDAVDKALDRLERIMLKRKGIRNKIREKVRFTKMFR
jgi:ribosome-associated translation inhibitor RaiA